MNKCKQIMRQWGLPIVCFLVFGFSAFVALSEPSTIKGQLIQLASVVVLVASAYAIDACIKHGYFPPQLNDWINEE